jgi:NitT/TauT family transport system permease protein
MAPVALGAVSVSSSLLIWWAAVRYGGLALPTPLDVVRAFSVQIGNGQLARDILASLGRVLTGYMLGVAVAIPVGFLMGRSVLVRGFFEPYIQFFRVIPPLALIPLAIVTLGIDETPKIAVIFMASFLTCVIATLQGVVNVDRTLINAARVLGAGNGTIFARVVIPASMPFILVGMRVGLGSAWATVVAAELIAAQAGVGFRMQQAQLYYDLPTIFVSLVTIGILGLIMDRMILWLERHLTAWQEKP